MEPVHYLECWQAGETPVPVTRAREQSQGMGRIRNIIILPYSPPPPRQVRAFCDVDAKKIEQGVYTYEESEVG